MPQDTKEQASETHDTRRQVMWINLDYATVATAMPLLMGSGHPAMAKIAEAIQQRLDEQNDPIVGADRRTGPASCDPGTDLTFDAAPVVTTGGRSRSLGLAAEPVVMPGAGGGMARFAAASAG